MTRGIKYLSDQLIDSMCANMLPYADGKAVQLAVRPVRFYELVFPKESLGAVLKGIGHKEGNDKKLEIQRNILRTALGAKKIPKMDLTKVNPINIHNVCTAIYPIGIKHDGVWKDGEFKGYELL